MAWRASFGAYPECKVKGRKAEEAEEAERAEEQNATEENPINLKYACRGSKF